MIAELRPYVAGSACPVDLYCAPVPCTALAPPATRRDDRCPAHSTLRKLLRWIGLSWWIRATPVATTLRRIRIHHASETSGTGVQHGTADRLAAGGWRVAGGGSRDGLDQTVMATSWPAGAETVSSSNHLPPSAR